MPKLPKSLDESMRQASHALRLELKAAGVGVAAGFDGSGSSARRPIFAIEMLAASESAQDAVALVKGILGPLGLPASAGPVAVAFSDADTAEAALLGFKPGDLGGPGVAPDVVLLSGEGGPPAPGHQLLVVADPRADEAPLVQAMVASAFSTPGRGPAAVVLLNALGGRFLPEGWEGRMVYCFQPLEVKGGFLAPGTGEGVLFKNVAEGPDWRVLVTATPGGELRSALAQAMRPSQYDLETVFYNLFAAESPVTKAARAIRERFAPRPQ